ncbi:sugar phosphate nucleotidyltransferase [Paenibacillus elgii]|uniref:sugar phosphate nucleotidyltransferase n=1 Tax=Paenibacillus elgii TaxID=189691 RepID=UPI0013D67485|nr:sugar phosphate nucleotidyltransferase [Paenibacillus elgii]
MKIILLSGGSGKRLWPLSNDSRSKQFLKLLPHPEGQFESMIQRVWRQLQQSGLEKDVFISTNKTQSEIIQNQLGADVPFILEPSRMDTFPAIALAVTYLHSVEQISKDEIIVVLPVDPYVSDSFYGAIKNLEELLITTGADIGLIGIKPTYPSEKYGYIIPKLKQDKLTHEVDYFIEKPDELEASKLIENNRAMWNAGVFAFRVKYLLKILESCNITTDYSLLLKKYNTLPKISFDYQVVEKSKNLIYITYNEKWKDLGTWNTLTEEMACPSIGKGVISKDSINTHLINELDIPVVILGTSNTIVAASLDGILVATKEASTKIKNYENNFMNRPMYEEKRWGYSRVVDYFKENNDMEVITKRINIIKGNNLSYQYHRKKTEIWTILTGEGVFVFNGEIRRVLPGELLHIPPFSKHAILARTDLEIIEVQMGPEVIEEDIERICYNWDEIILQGIKLP